MAAQVLLKLSLFTGDSTYWDAALQAVAGLANLMERHPTAFGEWLNAAGFVLGEPHELAIVGDKEQVKPLLDVVRSTYRPNLVVAAGPARDRDTIALLARRPQVNGLATAYVCRRFICQAPATDPAVLAAQLG